MRWHRRLIFFGESSLRRAVHAYLHHYYTERTHQGFGNEVQMSSIVHDFYLDELLEYIE